MVIMKVNGNHIRTEKRIPLQKVFDELFKFNLRERHSYEYVLGWLAATTEIHINENECHFRFVNGDSITVKDKGLRDVIANLTK